MCNAINAGVSFAQTIISTRCSLSHLLMANPSVIVSALQSVPMSRHSLLPRTGTTVVFKSFLCRLRKLLGASTRRCTATVSLCIRRVKSYQAPVMRSSSRWVACWSTDCGTWVSTVNHILRDELTLLAPAASSCAFFSRNVKPSSSSSCVCRSCPNC